MNSRADGPTLHGPGRGPNSGESELERKRRLGRARWHRFYARQTAGQGLARVRYTCGTVDTLISPGWLAPDKADDDDAITHAIEAWISDIRFSVWPANAPAAHATFGAP